MNSKILFTMALMATLTCAQEEPENNFPDEWDVKPKSMGPDKPKDRTVEEVAEYDEGMMKEYKEALTDQWSKPRRAYCKMQSNPAYPTSGPYGFINLW